MKKLFFTIVFVLIGHSFSFSQESSFVLTTNSMSENYSDTAFTGFGDDKDGYIHKGRITLYRVGSGRGDSFELYVKSATRYVKYKGRYYKIDGVQYVTINNVKYKTH